MANSRPRATESAARGPRRWRPDSRQRTRNGRPTLSTEPSTRVPLPAPGHASGPSPRRNGVTPFRLHIGPGWWRILIKSSVRRRRNSAGRLAREGIEVEHATASVGPPALAVSRSRAHGSGHSVAAEEGAHRVSAIKTSSPERLRAPVFSLYHSRSGWPVLRPGQIKASW